MNTSSNFDLDVLVHGSKAKVYKHQGKAFIEGREGSEFTIQIKNNTPQRVLAVLTVDGLSAIDGKEASFKSGGYILDPWGSIKVPGWRLNNDEVASFEFTSPGKSYAAKKGSGNNLGVIGCAFYYEKKDDVKELLDKIRELENTIPKIIEKHHHHYPKMDWTYIDFPRSGQTIYTSGIMSAGTTVSNNAMFMSASNSSNERSVSMQASPKEFNASLGTKFGDKTQHKVNEEEFKRSSGTPAEILTVNYDTRDGLKSRGVDVDWKPSVASPFPKEPDAGKYCEPPQDWQ